jgi:hypothetical protein
MKPEVFLAIPPAPAFKASKAIPDMICKYRNLLDTDANMKDMVLLVSGICKEFAIFIDFPTFYERCYFNNKYRALTCRQLITELAVIYETHFIMDK